MTDAANQQLCGWLLPSLERVSGESLVMSQALIANMLAVRREGVTVTTGKMHNLGEIAHRCENITVSRRPVLEELSCECYLVVKAKSDRSLAVSVYSMRN